MKKRIAYCFDLDGTITSVEVLPQIAAALSLHEEIEALTLATMQGVIPFHQSFKLRVRLLSALPVDQARDIVSSVPLFEDTMAFIKNMPNDSYIVTGNLDVWIQPLMEVLGCKSFSSIAEVSDNHVVGIKTIVNKGDAILELRRDYESIVAIGDGANDVAMFEQADIGIAFGGVHSPAKILVQAANYVTYDAEGLCRLLNTL